MVMVGARARFAGPGEGDVRSSVGCGSCDMVIKDGGLSVWLGRVDVFTARS